MALPTAQNGPDEDVGTGPTIGAPGANGFADGVVYIDGKDGIEYALDLLTGKQIWSFTLGAGSGNALAVSEAALAGNTLVVGFAGSVFALNATTGAKIWKVTPGGTIQASIAVSGGPGDQVLFTGDLNDHEYGFSLASGAKVFAFTTSGKIQDSSAVAKGVLYFAAGGTLYAYAPGLRSEPEHDGVGGAVVEAAQIPVGDQRRTTASSGAHPNPTGLPSSRATRMPHHPLADPHPGQRGSR